MKTVDYNDFRNNLNYWFDRIVNHKKKVTIKLKGSKDTVLISLDEYNSLKETVYLLSGKNGDILLNSINELERESGC